MIGEIEESLQALSYLASHAERAGMQGMDRKDGLPIHNKLEEARHFAQQKKWGQAEAKCLEVVALTPRNVSAINVLGLIGVKTGDHEKAVKYYEQSLAIDPQQFRVHGVLGGIAITEGELDRAQKEFQTAIELPFGNRDSSEHSVHAELLRID